MHLAEGRVDSAGRARVEVRKLRGALDLLAWVVAEDGCRRGPDGEGFCWVAPPRWMWLIGVPDRTWTLGGAIYHFGQWAHRRTDGPGVVWSRDVDGRELVAFGWDSATLEDV